MAVLSALGTLEPASVVVSPPNAAAPPLRGTAGLAALCPPRTLPEGNACIPLPASDAPLEADLAPSRADDAAGWPAAEGIPRRPDRPLDPLLYVYPVSTPDSELRLVASTAPSATDGVQLMTEPGREVRLVALDHEEGQAEVLFVAEPLAGPIDPSQRAVSLATKHALREGGRLRTYVILFDRLDRIGPGVVTGSRLSTGQLLGFAADGGEVAIAARQIREGVSLGGLDPKRVLDAAISIPTDPRNVFPIAAR